MDLATACAAKPKINADIAAVSAGAPCMTTVAIAA